MEKIERFIISENFKNKRLDIAICENFSNLTRNYIHKLILNNRVFLNNENVNKHKIVKLNDEIVIRFPEVEKFDIVAQNICLDIVYEDDEIVVVNKPKGMVVHPAPGHFKNTLVNALMCHCKGKLSTIGGALRPGIVHRIDKDTSGLILVAKTNEAYYSLVDQIKEHSVIRIYEALVHGKLRKLEGVLNFPIGRNRLDRKKMAVDFKNGKTAITHFKVIKQFEKFTHVKLKLETGRTHQIRVHMAYINHPIVGDSTYGSKKINRNLNGQFLHSKTIKFFHYKLKKNLFFTSEIETSFKNFLHRL